MSSGYLRYPHIHGDLLTFVAGDAVWLAPAAGGRAWRLSAEDAPVSHPRFSRDGTRLAWSSGRDGNPEVYSADTEGSPAVRLTYWGDPQTRVTGWTTAGEVLAVTAAHQPAGKYRRAYAVPGDGPPPRLLPFGAVNDVAIEDAGTALLTASVAGEPAFWKRYRGGRAGKLWIATPEDPLFTRVLADLGGQLASPMLIGGRLFFLSDHEGTGNIYSCALDGAGVARHTDHDPSGRWVVDRVLPGESSAGDEIVAVDGQPVDPRRGPWPLLAGTAGKPVELVLLAGGTTPPDPPAPGGTHPPRPPLGGTHPPALPLRRVVVVPLRDERRLRYQDWVAGRRRLVDGTSVTVPRYAFSFDQYGWGVENYGVDPDAEVLITPDDWAAGRDPQLETAVQLALEALDTQPPPAPPDTATGPVKSRRSLPPREAQPSLASHGSGAG